ncbi:Uu.00g129030.m01.CDS01 [Anthostomella pinea]|uniref:Uu.00g129030.m01.CDS01 n=1 Tax=Anthostomella pinea TaxID=933095 RepID=A0AAI8VIE3_9PEZI|nr:Uu.00g129030.m01.CDS01 [Anthostomella pinea]
MSSPPAASTHLKKSIPYDQWISYRIGRGEQGVLTFEPYKSSLLPLWRFRSVPIARKSASDLWARFEEFDEQSDFAGMDMVRKFIQMGMTRSKRYANHAGGRKYRKGTREELPKSAAHKDKQEKEAASQIFREVWERCKAHEGYQRGKEEFLKQQAEWRKGQDAK